MGRHGINQEISPVNMRAMRALAGRWKPGMLATDGWRWVRMLDPSPSAGRLRACGRGARAFEAASGRGWAPDLGDPATVGGLHQATVEAVADTGIAIYWVSYGADRVQIVAGISEDVREMFYGRTFAEALVAVLELANGSLYQAGRPAACCGRARRELAIVDTAATARIE